MSLRLGFMGTGDFAVPSLRALHAAGHSLALVVCQPDRPKGRGQLPRAPALKQAAQALGLEVWQPERMRDPASVERFRAAGLDLACVVAYGQILPQAVLDAPRLGCINVHASLLPRWRGAAPIEWALAEGDAQTGVCVQRMAYKLDAGAVLLSARRDLTPQDDAPALHAELAQRGAELLLQAVEGLQAGTLSGTPQDESAVSLAPLLKKGDGDLDPAWTRARLLNRFRAFKARPGCRIRLLPATLLKVLGLEDGGPQPCGEPGSLAELGNRGFRLACADGSVWLTELQAPSGRPMAAQDYARGHQIQAGARFGRPEAGQEGSA
jgi:methionyl-tRNA formyltransferase